MLLAVSVAALNGCPIALWTHCGFLTTCTSPGAALPDSLQQRWDSAERAIRKYAEHSVTPVSIPMTRAGAPSSMDVYFVASQIVTFDTSDRHGAKDKRRLTFITSHPDGTADTTIGPLATIWSRKGIEYKKDADFETGPIVIAKIRVEDPKGYSPLHLESGDNFWIVRQLAPNSWVGWIQAGATDPQSHEFTKPATKIIVTTPLAVDPVSPTVSAQFVWDPNDETLWGRCGGRCCSTKGQVAQ